MAFLRRAWFLLLGAGWLGLQLCAQAQSAEHKLEAAYLCRLVDYIDWPTATNKATGSPLVIGILGRDPFGTALDEVAQGQTSGGHPLVIRRFDSLSDIGDCQELFISGSESSRLSSILHDLSGRPILTVSDIGNFNEKGGILRFYTDAKKVRFHINLDEAKACGLSISSRLLQLAGVTKGNE